MKDILNAIIANKVTGGGGTGSGLPSGGSPHQMLVTDADGNTVWEDRTHYEERLQFKFDGDLTGRKVMEVGGIAYVRVGNFVEPDELIGATMHVSGWGAFITGLGGSLEELPDTTTITESMLTVNDDSTYSVAVRVLPVISGVPDGVTSVNGVDGFESGIYVVYVPQGATMGDIVFPEAVYADEIIGAEATIKQIDEKYIPDSVKGGGVFLFEVTSDDTDGYSSSATYAEIGAALAAGKVAYCVYNGGAYPFSATNDTSIFTGVSAYFAVKDFLAFGGFSTYENATWIKIYSDEIVEVGNTYIAAT